MQMIVVRFFKVALNISMTKRMIWIEVTVALLMFENFYEFSNSRINGFISELLYNNISYGYFYAELHVFIG